VALLSPRLPPNSLHFQFSDRPAAPPDALPIRLNRDPRMPSVRWNRGYLPCRLRIKWHSVFAFSSLNGRMSATSCPWIRSSLYSFYTSKFNALIESM